MNEFSKLIYMQTVNDFLKWFEGYSLESQKSILRYFATNYPSKS